MRSLTRMLVAGCALAFIAPAQSLTFWNTFDGDAAVLDSVVGPPLVFYAGGGRPYETVVGTRAYKPGVSGSAFTLGPAPYEPGIRTHALELPNPGSVLNSEHGTIEAWYFSRQETAPYVNNSHTLFGQMPDCSFEAGMLLYVNHPWFWNTARVSFMIQLCGAQVEVISIFDGLPGCPLLNALDQWMHFAAVWDRAGISGTNDTVRLYLNGHLVAKSTASNWGTSFGPVAAVGGAADYDLVHKYYLDEMKFWDSARTTFDLNFRIYAAQVDGPGSAILNNYCGKPGWTYFTVMTANTLNAGGGLGTGPWGGVHISPAEVLFQWSTQQEPFVGMLDPWGDSKYVWPQGTLAALAGVTFYTVTYALDPMPSACPIIASWPTELTLY